MFTLVFLVSAALLSLATPTVKLDSAIVTGVTEGSIDKFLGIPFALPPTGELRFRKPSEHPPYNGSINATSYGPSCIQQNTPPSSNLTSLTGRVQEETGSPESEDCLTINVIRPSSISDVKLPVVILIYPGGFEEGRTSLFDPLGLSIVQRSTELSSQVIFVSMNYRVSALGFLASKEVAEDHEGNMGLLDQRLALTWVQKYIGEFCGDKSKVMLWGQSAGAISISLHMLAYGGTTNDLFHAAFMMSGAPSSTGDLTGGQEHYDFLVQETGCNNSTQTLSCLRQVPIDILRAAIDKTPSFESFQSLNLAWRPRTDNNFLLDNPQRLVQQGKVAPIPFVSGNCDDEGTRFSFSNLNITTEVDFRGYIRTTYVSKASASDLDPMFTLYTSDPEEGSPFNTSSQNTLSPQFKRMAALQGDLIFQAPRRFFLSQTSSSLKAWSYLSKRRKSVPFLGSSHGSDLELGILNDFVIRMAVNHDPNNATSLDWPQYSPNNRSLFTFGVNDSNIGDISITEDKFREAQLEYLTNLSLAFPL